MRVLLNDGMDKEGIDLFNQAGVETDVEKKDLDRLVAEIGNYDGLLVRSATKVTRAVIEAGMKGYLKIIGRAGVGYDNVDVVAATEKGIVVKCAPHGNTNATAELALSLMLAVSRNIPQAHYSLKSGLWKKKAFEGSELSHKVLGIIGCGRIGQRLSELVLGFGMDVIGYDLIINPESKIKYLPKDEVLSKADYISLHAGGKQVIIGERELSLMKPNAYLVNASRGANIDEEALYKALEAKRIAGAGLDVYSQEPKEGNPFSNKLAGLDNVVLTSHLGASTDEAQRKTSIEMASAVIDFLTKGNFSNAVNAGETVSSEQKPVYPLFIFHKDMPGVFAKVDEVLSNFNINIRENPSRELGNDGNAMTVYLLHQRASPEVIVELRKLPAVYRVCL